MPALIALTPVTKRLEAEVLRLATTPRTTISIVGPCGVGKQAWARRLHAESERHAAPFIVLEPGASLSDEVIAAATGGCLFLREAAQLGQLDQQRLLELLANADATTPRIIAASRATLGAAVQAGDLSEALEYRLNVLALEVPALGERLGELGALAQALLIRVAGETGLLAPELGSAALEALAARDWPGNLHELAWVLRGALLGRLSTPQNGTFTVDEMQIGVGRGSEGPPPTTGLSLDALEESAVRRALEACGGNRSLAARSLGIHRTTLYHKMRRFGL